jgi:hypothetical protein
VEQISGFATPLRWAFYVTSALGLITLAVSLFRLQRIDFAGSRLCGLSLHHGCDSKYISLALALPAAIGFDLDLGRRHYRSLGIDAAVYELRQTIYNSCPR